MATMIRIDDGDDPRLGDYRDLRDVTLRKSLEVEHGLFLAEGEKVVRRAVERGYPVRSFLLSERWIDSLSDVLAGSDAPCYLVDAELAERVTGFHVHRGALASMQRTALPKVGDVIGCEESAPASERRRSRIAILEDLVDHTNVGACFRSAAAMGVDAVLVTPRCADPLYRRSIKVSMGAVFQVPWTRVEPWPDGIDVVQDAGYVVAGMTLGEGAITLDELVSEDHQNLALVFGTEGHGITPRADRRLDRRVTIPMMHGVDSLNAAASSAVAFYATR